MDVHRGQARQRREEETEFIASTRAPATIDLNADLGEGIGQSRLNQDEVLLGLVSSANIACGFHAGDATTMRETVRMAARRGVAIGAHPSYPDIPGFGRRELGLPPEEISRHVAYQIRSLQDVCTRENAKLIHVKPHGALYNRAARDPGAADAIASAIREVDAGLLLLGLAASEMMRAARRADITFVSEAFADRAYRSDGTLVPRGEPGAVLGDADLVVSRAVRLVMENTIVAEDGVELRIEARSLCVHGDNPQAETILGALRAGLERAGVKIAPFST